jgi:membrane protein
MAPEAEQPRSAIEGADVATNGKDDPAPVLIPSDPAVDVKALEARSPWRLSLRDTWQVLKRIWLMWGFHNISLLAGGVAFFSFLALTPLIAAIVLLYGLIADVSTVERQVAALAGLIPADAASVLESQLVQVVTTSSSITGIGLIVALSISVYGAMYAANGLIAALNVINTELETRGVIALTRRAIFLTLAAVMIGLTGLISGGLFAWLTNFAAPWLGPFAVVFKVGAWVSAFVLGTWGFALIMRYGPDRRPAKWRWLTPGAIVATALWMTSSFGFSLYVAYITNYSATYGSLSAVVVFLLWLYLSAYGALLGALINAELERQTAADSTEGPDRPLGERGAVVADTVVTDSLTAVYLAKRKRRLADRLAARSGGAPTSARNWSPNRRRRKPDEQH